MNTELHLERKYQRKLNELDLNLFLDKEFDPDIGVFYVVKEIPSLGEEPLTILEWRTANGPLPLSDELIIQLRLQEGSIKQLIAESKIRNLALQELAKKEKDETYDTIMREFQKSSKVLHVSGPWAPKHDVTGWSNKKKRN